MTVIDERVSSATRSALARDIFGHVIDGELTGAKSGATLDVVNPSSGDVIAQAAAGNADDVDRAARSARAAYEDGRWRNQAPMAKERVLRAEPITGGANVAEWIADATKDLAWQHHLLSVYHTEINRDTATALTYHTSYQLPKDDPTTVFVLVGRYHQQLRRGTAGWQLTRLVFEILWGERRQDTTGYLAEVGGSGQHPIP